MRTWAATVTAEALAEVAGALKASRPRANESAMLLPTGSELRIVSDRVATSVPLASRSGEHGGLGISVDLRTLADLLGLDHGTQNCDLFISGSEFHLGTTSIPGTPVELSRYLPGSEEDLALLRGELRTLVASGKASDADFRDFAILGRPTDFIELGVLPKVEKEREAYASALARAESSLRKYGVSRTEIEALAVRRYAELVSRRRGRM